MAAPTSQIAAGGTSSPRGLTRAARLSLLESMARSRKARRQLAGERDRLRLPALTGLVEPGWEAIEAGVAQALQPGDTLVANSPWMAGGLDGVRVGATWRLVDPLAAGMGAAVVAAAGAAVAVLAQAQVLTRNKGTLRLAVERRLPLLIAAAALGAADDEIEAATQSGIEPVVVSTMDVERIAAATIDLAARARAGEGPGVIVAQRPLEAAPSPATFGDRFAGDPLPRYARRLNELGISADELRHIVRAVRDAA